MNIWVPKLKIAESRNLQLERPLTTGFAGRFRLRGRLDDGRERVIAEFPNIILDAGLERWGTGEIIDDCVVGAGNAIPLISDTSLQSFLRASASLQSSTSGSVNTSPRYVWHKRTYTFNPPGANLSIAEIGVGWASNGGSLFSRALILDGSGNPTTRTWLSQETLYADYELRKYIPEDDIAYEETIGGTTYTGVYRAADVSGQWAVVPDSAMAMKPISLTNYFRMTNGALGAITTSPAGTSISASNFSFPAYVPGSLERYGTFTFSTSQSLAGIQSWHLRSIISCWQRSMSPTMEKLINYTMLVTVHSQKWGRYGS